MVKKSVIRGFRVSAIVKWAKCLKFWHGRGRRTRVEIGVRKRELRRSSEMGARQQCHVSQTPNEVLALVFSCLPLGQPICIPDPTLAPRDCTVDEQPPRTVRHPQIIVLAWVSRQFRRVAHEHSFWQTSLCDLGGIIANCYVPPNNLSPRTCSDTIAAVLPTWLDDLQLRTCLARKSFWLFTDLSVFEAVHKALPSVPLTTTAIALGTPHRTIFADVFFNALPPFPNVTHLALWPQPKNSEDDALADLAKLNHLFPSLEATVICDSPGYTGNIHDVVGLSNVVVMSKTGNDQLIPYGSADTLSTLSLRFPHLDTTQPQFARFANLLCMRLFPLSPKLRNLLIPMPSKLRTLHVSITPDYYDDYLFSPPCFQHLQELQIAFEHQPGSEEGFDPAEECTCGYFHSVVQQITKLHFLQEVHLTSGHFDMAWLPCFRNLRELRILRLRPQVIFFGSKQGDQRPFATVLQVLVGECFSGLDDLALVFVEPGTIVRRITIEEDVASAADIA